MGSVRHLDGGWDHEAEAVHGRADHCSWSQRVSTNTRQHVLNGVTNDVPRIALAQVTPE